MPAVLALARPLTAYDYAGPLIVAPILVAISYPILKGIARRDRDPRVLQFLIFVLVVKLAMSFVRYYMIARVYGNGDAIQYDLYGGQLSQRFRSGEFAHGLGNLSGTNFIRLLTGVVYTVIGRTILGGFVVFAWLGFWGHLLWYRAFRVAVPEGAAERYGRAVFFLPSLLLWPTSIGKEAWLTFALGIAAYGVARALTGSALRGLGVLAIGLWGTAMVRPHMAILIAAPGVIAAVLSKARARMMVMAPLRKLVVVGALLAGSLVFVSQAATFFKVEGTSSASVTEVLEETQRRSSKGGSEFAASIVTSPADIPVAAMTTLFRPFPWEAHNVLSLLAAAESMYLLYLLCNRFGWVVRALRLARVRGFLGFCVLYVIGFATGFSAVANFGILARQRTLILPALIALLYVPPVRRVLRAPQHAPLASG